jgi:hypothetical protein
MVPVLRVLGAAGDTLLRGLRATAHRRSGRAPHAITDSDHAVTGHGSPAAVGTADAAGHHSAAAGSALSHAVAAAAGRSVARRLAGRRLTASGASATGSWFR